MGDGLQIPIFSIVSENTWILVAKDEKILQNNLDQWLLRHSGCVWKSPWAS